jgi:hypothetical protein
LEYWDFTIIPFFNYCIYPVRNNAPLLCIRVMFWIIPAGFNAPLEFLTGFTPQRLTFLNLKTPFRNRKLRKNLSSQSRFIFSLGLFKRLKCSHCQEVVFLICWNKFGRGIQTLKNLVIKLQPILKKNGLFCFSCATLDSR